MSYSITPEPVTAGVTTGPQEAPVWLRLPRGRRSSRDLGETGRARIDQCEHLIVEAPVGDDRLSPIEARPAREVGVSSTASVTMMRGAA
jgi:hypothetical protein